MVRFLALRAQPANEPLGHDPFDGAGDQERFDSHVDDPGERTGRIVGVERAEYRVTGQRSLDGVFGRFSIPNFTDEHDVWVMPKDASQRGSKGQTDLGVNLDLIDPIELVLDWVLGRDDLVLRRSNLQKRTVKRGRFARAGRAGDENDPVGDTDQLAELTIGLFPHTEASQVELHGPLVQDPHDKALAVDHRDDRDANVDFPTVDPELDSPVLGQSLLGDVQLGHDLQTRDNGSLETVDFRRHRLGLKDTVDAVTHDDPACLGFDVHVTGPSVDRLDEDLVDEPNHGGFLRLFAQLTAVGLEFLEQLDLVVFIAPGGHKAFDGFATDTQVFLDEFGDLNLFGHQRDDCAIQGRRSLVEWVELEWVARCDIHATAFLPDREDRMAIDQFLGEGLKQGKIDIGLSQIDVIDPEFFGDRLERYLFFDESFLHDALENPAAVHRRARLVHLGLVDQPALYQNVSSFKHHRFDYLALAIASGTSVSAAGVATASVATAGVATPKSTSVSTEASSCATHSTEWVTTPSLHATEALTAPLASHTRDAEHHAWVAPCCVGKSHLHSATCIPAPKCAGIEIPERLEWVGLGLAAIGRCRSLGVGRRGGSGLSSKDRRECRSDGVGIDPGDGCDDKTILAALCGLIEHGDELFDLFKQLLGCNDDQGIVFLVAGDGHRRFFEFLGGRSTPSSTPSATAKGFDELLGAWRTLRVLRTCSASETIGKHAPHRRFDFGDRGVL